MWSSSCSHAVSSDNIHMTGDEECPNCRVLGRQVGALRREVESLRDELRRGKRQAAPFGKDAPKTDPKRPGRKKGHRGSFRLPPPPEEISEIVQVPLERCPRCGGPVEGVRDNAPVYQTDMPDVRPVVKRFDTRRGWCPRCNRRVRSRHPDQTSDAAGAAGSGIGPNALALAADLKHRLGLSFRKVVDLFQVHFGLSVTPGALAQASHRLAERRVLAVTEDRLAKAVRVLLGDDEASVGDDLRYRAGVGANDRYATKHSLRKDAAVLLLPGGDAAGWEDKHVHGAEMGRDLVSGNRGEMNDTFGDGEGVDLVMEGIQVTATADDEELVVGRKLGDGFEEDVEALLPDDAAAEADNSVIG